MVGKSRQFFSWGEGALYPCMVSHLTLSVPMSCSPFPDLLGATLTWTRPRNLALGAPEVIFALATSDKVTSRRSSGPTTTTFLFLSFWTFCLFFPLLFQNQGCHFAHLLSNGFHLFFPNL